MTYDEIRAMEEVKVICPECEGFSEPCDDPCERCDSTGESIRRGADIVDDYDVETDADAVAQFEAEYEPDGKPFLFKGAPFVFYIERRLIASRVRREQDRDAKIEAMGQYYFEFERRSQLRRETR